MKRSSSKIGLAILFSIGISLCACGDEPYYRAYEKKYYPWYKQPNVDTEERVVEKQEIVRWKTDLLKATRIGYLEKVEVIYEGSRDPRYFYRVYDRHNTMIAHATENGEFYRYDPDGRQEFMGPYPVTTTGMRVLFNVPLTEKVGVRPIQY